MFEVGIFMAKYNFEFKLKIAQEYLNGKAEHLIYQKSMPLRQTAKYKNRSIIT